MQADRSALRCAYALICAVSKGQGHLGDGSGVDVADVGSDSRSPSNIIQRKLADVRRDLRDKDVALDMWAHT